MAKDAFTTQQMVRQNTEEVVNKLKDLQSWTQEMKERDKMKNKKEAVQVCVCLVASRTLSARSILVTFFFQLLCLSVSFLQSDDGEEVPLRSDREAFGEFQSRIKRSKTVGDELNESVDKDEADRCKERGNEFVRRQDFDNAIHFYTKAIGLYSAEPTYFANLALCLLRKDRFAECIEACDTALGLNPDLIKALFRRSQAYEALNENAKAADDMRRVIQLEPKVPSHQRDLERLRARLSSQSFERAAKELEKKVWLPLAKNQKYVNFINKNPNYRSQKPMKRVKIEEVLPSMPPPVTDAGERIPDAVIDKLFNNNTGECTAEPLPSRHSLDFGAFYRRKHPSPPKELDVSLRVLIAFERRKLISFCI